MIHIENEEIKSYKSRLKRIRVSSGLTQTELAHLSGINVKSIASYEQNPNKINKASVEAIYSIADSLGCNIEDLIEKNFIQS